MNEKFYTVEAAAELLNSNEQTIRKLINEGNLKASKKLRKWYILHSDILEFLKTSDNDG
jgi:excisionase family DNA binding protein